MLRADLILRFLASSIGATVNHDDQYSVITKTEDKENYVEHPIPAAPVATPRHPVPPKAMTAHTAWVKGSKDIAAFMLITMDLEIQRNLTHLGAYDMLQELKSMFAELAEQELMQTAREFHSCKQEEGQSVNSYVLKMKIYIDNLERLGHPVTLNLGNYNTHNMGKTVNELHAMLKQHEQTLPKKDVAPVLHAICIGKFQKNQGKKPFKAAKGNQGNEKYKLAYAPEHKPSYASKPKKTPPPKKDNPAKDATCHQCGETGHWRRNYPVYLAELLKKNKLSPGASTSETYHGPSPELIR
ncbi:zinc finger, CCHC-type [Artemisia annua]|uniref:Zinc finger, CCHC-type n=1 Tax=Artemisia annua TaxID=35608 RepID=A0A2U1LAA0_ARTAN|nr:zinc finger, CCHC-type [Artemisia annua]